MGGACSTQDVRSPYEIFVWRTLEGRDDLRNLDVSGRVMLKFWLFNSLRIELLAGFCENGNERSGYVRDGEFLDHSFPK
jgi:hypothetical protein